MSNKIIHGMEAVKELEKGVDILADTIRCTLGPKGKNVVIDRSHIPGNPWIINDGSTIAKEVELSNDHENIGAVLIKDSAAKTNEIAGDGSTTSALLAQKLIKEGIKNVEAGANPILIREGMNKALAEVITSIKEMSVIIENDEQLKQIASISSKDEYLGGLIAEALKTVGKDGMVFVEESNLTDIRLEIIEGAKFDKGFVSKHMVTEQEDKEAVLKDPYIIVSEKGINIIEDLLPVMEKVVNASASLLIIAPEFSDQVINTLVVNKINGTIKVAAAKAPGIGDRLVGFLEDMSILTGAKMVSVTLDTKISELELEDLGRAESVVLDKDSTTIIGAKSDKAEIEKRILQLQNQIEQEEFDHFKLNLLSRISRLNGKAAKINVGGNSEVEIKDAKYRADKSLSAAKAALEMGVVPGGGIAYVNSESALDKLVKELEGDEKTGVVILKDSLEYPFMQILSNAGIEGDRFIEKLKEKGNGYGYDVMTEQIVNMFEKGITDPAKVCINALENAVSIASSFLTIKAATAVEKEKVDPHQEY